MRKSTWGSKIGYGMGDMYAGGAFLLIGLLFVYFLTDVVGLRPALAGAVFTVGKVWDAISDPMMGFISDRTKSRFGRRRLYFIIGIVPIFATFLMLWMNIQSNNQWVLFAYYLTAYILFNTVFTMVMVPYNALLPNMITDYRLRTSYNTVRLSFSAISAILSGVLPTIIVGMAPSEPIGYVWMGIVFGLIYALPWLVVVAKTWENPGAQPPKFDSFLEVFKEFLTAFKNKSFKIHTTFFVAGQMAVDFLTTLFIYYLTYVLDRADEFSAVLGTLLVVQLICMMFVHGRISRRFGKTVPLRIGQSIWIGGLVLALFVSKDSPGYMVYIVAAMSGVGSSASTFVPWSILPEISDVDEIMTGRRREGIYAGMSTLIRKMAQALSIQIIAIVLDVVGYVGGAEQTPNALMGIRLLFFVGPVILMIIAMIASRAYKMTEEKHHILMGEIASRKEGQASSQDPMVKEICEELTGQPYEVMSDFL